jgi:hypothetical protein
MSCFIGKYPNWISRGQIVDDAKEEVGGINTKKQ